LDASLPTALSSDHHLIRICRVGYAIACLHNSESSKGQIDYINLPRTAKSISFCCSLKEILERPFYLVMYPQSGYCNILCNCDLRKLSRAICCAGRSSVFGGK